MQEFDKKTELNIKLNTEELGQVQVRLLKSMNGLMAQLLTAEDEAEYFELSAEFLRKAAEVIKHSQFAEKNQTMSYGAQAIEFAMDYLNETLEENKLNNIDN